MDRDENPSLPKGAGIYFRAGPYSRFNVEQDIREPEFQPTVLGRFRLGFMQLGTTQAPGR